MLRPSGLSTLAQFSELRPFNVGAGTSTPAVSLALLEPRNSAVPEDSDGDDDEVDGPLFVLKRLANSSSNQSDISFRPTVK